MQTIHKYPLEVSAVNTFQAPLDAWPLCVQMQHGKPTLWMLVTPDKDQASFQAIIFGTGHPVESVDNRQYVGTVQDGEFVWHVFLKQAI